MVKKDNSMTSEEVVNRIAAIMQSKSLNVGDRLPSIRQLASIMDVSTSVIRDALVRAQAMGVIRLFPRSGAYVQSNNIAPVIDTLTTTLSSSLRLHDQNIIYLLDARRVLEIESVTLAAQRRHIEDLIPVQRALDAMNQIDDPDKLPEYVQADIDFHLGIAKAAGNPVLSIVLDGLFECIEPFLRSSFLGSPWNHERRTRSMLSHREIYRAIVEQDVASARSAIDEHLRLAREKLMDNVHQIDSVHQLNSVDQATDSEHGIDVNGSLDPQNGTGPPTIKLRPGSVA
jgi:DNA-binding FadR family transcriptional regulator